MKHKMDLLTTLGATLRFGPNTYVKSNPFVSDNESPMEVKVDWVKAMYKGYEKAYLLSPRQYRDLAKSIFETVEETLP